ncbi:MAG TPA: hypothetical protein PKZ07_16080 [Sedimentisphaerales bacterium]|nr:hypothetical protein [Sedimentisphaerales bacterium]
MLTPFFLYQPLSDTGAPVPGGTLTFYATGTTTPKDVFADADGLVPLANPVTLDGTGRKLVFLDNDGAYDVVFADADAVEVWTMEKIAAWAPAF